MLFVDHPDNRVTTSGIHAARSHLEGTPSSPSPTLSSSSIDASCYMTPVACQVPATLCFSPEPVLPSLPSISATPGFSAFTRVVQEPMCSQPDEANSNKSPHKASCALLVLYVKFQFFLFCTKVLTLYGDICILCLVVLFVKSFLLF